MTEYVSCCELVAVNKAIWEQNEILEKQNELLERLVIAMERQVGPSEEPGPGCDKDVGQEDTDGSLELRGPSGPIICPRCGGYPKLSYDASTNTASLSCCGMKASIHPDSLADSPAPLFAEWDGMVRKNGWMMG